MKELFKYLVIRLTTRHAKTAIEIYKDLYHTECQTSKINQSVGSVKSHSTISTSKTKKDELLESLEYLKSKKTKSKQDKESIYTLEMVLKNM